MLAEAGPEAFRHERMTEMLRDHLHLASTHEALDLLAEIRSRGG